MTEILVTDQDAREYVRKHPSSAWCGFCGRGFAGRVLSMVKVHDGKPAHTACKNKALDSQTQLQDVMTTAVTPHWQHFADVSNLRGVGITLSPGDAYELYRLLRRHVSGTPLSSLRNLRTKLEDALKPTQGSSSTSWEAIARREQARADQYQRELQEIKDLINGKT